eukprot:TRINITY_DN33722_c0_g1_i1.p1 TRINITY_DN33722_c0_g1~~TRINITY_DN33722_c0_g1_i1.p1  ORF type:complete len:652 (+),score=153.02 TRINITY_DN33722_c0_g1_i1:33-1958(+)
MVWLTLLTAFTLIASAETHGASVNSWGQEWWRDFKPEDLETCAGNLEASFAAHPSGRRRPHRTFTDQELLRLLQPLFAKLPPEALQPRPQPASSAASIAFLFVTFLILVFFIGACSNQQKTPKRQSSAGLVQRWARDLVDVFFVFPWMGAKVLLDKVVVTPLAALRSLADDLQTAQKLRLQRQLLEEGDGSARSPSGAAKRERAGSGGSSRPGKAKHRTAPTAPSREKQKDADRATSSASPHSVQLKAAGVPVKKRSPSPMQQASEEGAAASLDPEPPSAPIDEVILVEGEVEALVADSPVQAPELDKEEVLPLTDCATEFPAPLTAAAVPSEPTEEVPAAALAEEEQADAPLQELAEWHHVQRENPKRREQGQCSGMPERRGAPEGERHADSRPAEKAQPRSPKNEAPRARPQETSSAAGRLQAPGPAAPSAAAPSQAVRTRGRRGAGRSRAKVLQESRQTPVATEVAVLPMPSEPPPAAPQQLPQPHSPGRELLELLRQPPAKPAAESMERHEVAPASFCAAPFDDRGCISGGTGGTPGSWHFSQWHVQPLQPCDLVEEAAQLPQKSSVEDDVGLRLEAMVEELAGANSFELLEDAFSKVDAAREALCRVVSDSGLHHSAPAFTPGQMWPGSQRSSFVD